MTKRNSCWRPRKRKSNTPNGREPLCSVKRDLRIDREALISTHPVITGDFTIPTPPIQRAFRLMCQTITSGAPGSAFVAFPRFGKTWAARYCQQMLDKAFPNLPVIRFHAHHERRSPQRFYTDLLQQSGFGDGRLRPRTETRDQLVRAWWVHAQSRSAKTLVLIGDEMQCLTRDDFSSLIDITNDLQVLEVSIIMLSFGQPELAALRAVFRETHRGDIIGRFMSRVFAFDGLSSAAELRDVMSYYDDPEEFQYPSSSNCSFSQFFLPQAYAHGWRLAACASVCWEQFRSQAVTRLSSAGTVQKLSLGMEWVVRTLHFVLVNYSDLDEPGFRVSDDQWGAAIESSGFADSLGLTYDPEWQT